MSAIQHDVLIKGSSSDIFSAFTTESGLNAWWTLEAAGQLEKDSEYTFYFGPDWDWRAQVKDFESDSFVDFLIVKSDSDWEGTSLHFKIIPSDMNGETQLLRFEHTDWKVVNKHFRRTSYCWALYLRGLKRYVELGVIVPYGDRTL